MKTEIDEDVDQLLAELEAEDTSEFSDEPDEDPEIAALHLRISSRWKLLPTRMRRLLGRIRRQYFLDQILDSVIDEAQEWGSLETGVEPKDVHPALLKRLLKDAWKRPSYRRAIRALTKSVMTEQAHLGHRMDDKALPEVAPRSIPATQTWEVQCDCGLNSTPTMEAMPEEVALAIAGIITGYESQNEMENDDDDQCVIDIQLPRPNTRRVLQLGAGPSTLALAIDALEVGTGRTQLTEVEAYEWSRSTACVHNRLLWDQTYEGAFDCVVLSPPCPGEGVGAQLRNKYLKSNEGPLLDRQRLDPGRFGPKKWTRVVALALKDGVEHLKPGGLVIAYLPLGIRAPLEIATGERRWGTGYIDCPELGAWDEAFDLLCLRTKTDLQIVEATPRPQPYVDLRRPSYRLLLAKKAES